MANILNPPGRFLKIAAAIFPVVTSVSQARADIFQWKYINPADPSQGKRQSTTLAPGGAGVDALPGAEVTRRDLTIAYLIGANLSGADLSDACVLLDGCIVLHTDLTDADFTGADVRGARFRARSSTPVISLAQIYSTGSYQAHDLTGIDVSGNYLAGGNFAGQNLTNAKFWEAALWDADFTDAEIRGAGFVGFHGRGIPLTQLYSTASYQSHDLTGVSFVGNYLNSANFAGQNLTNADFNAAKLTDADFTGAQVRGAYFGRPYISNGNEGTGITSDQLYSTESYQSHDLPGITFDSIDLSGWSFARQNLANARFATTLLTGADFTAADMRGAEFADYLLFLADSNTMNMIRPVGNIDGLDLNSGALLVVRDDDIGSYHNSSWPPIPITVDQQLTMAPGGTLRMVFEADAWDSTISFAPGIPVTLGGTLELTFADAVNLATQLGRTFDLFDWTGVNPIGTFAISSPFSWNLSELYTTGEITLTAIPEPASVAVSTAGVLALTHYPRRKRP
jgi:uncharacterized protein YjbI with pentapeptide repeats